MSEYNIPCLVKADSECSNIPNMTRHKGTVIMLRGGPRQYSGPQTENWSWFVDWIIPNPTPAQIAEEARKAGKVPMTTATTKPPKPDPLAQAIAEAQERVQGLLSLKETYHSIAERKKVIASERGCIGGLEEKAKELRAKWLPEKPKAAKAGRKVK